MKRFCFFLAVLLFMLVLSVPVFAEPLSQNEEGLLEDFGIDVGELNELSDFSAQNVFDEILSFLRDKGKTPLKTFLSLALSFTVFGFFSAFCGEEPKNVNAVCLAVIGAETLYPVCSLIRTCAEALKDGSIFLLSLFPALAATVSASGKPLSAAKSSALLLGAAEITRSAATYTVVPLLSAFLALSLGAAVWPDFGKSGFCASVKNGAVKILGFCSALFLGVLSVTEKFAAASDGVGTRAARLVLSGIPVGGAALGEMWSGVLGSVGILKNTLAAYAGAALIIMLLPALIEIICYRLVLFGAKTVAFVFGGFGNEVISAFDSVLSVLLSLLLFFGGIFIISLGAVVGV